MKGRAEAIIDAGNAAYTHGRQAIEHVKSGDAESAFAFARDAARAGVRGMILVGAVSCCAAAHYPGETCATLGASASQVEVK